MANPISNYVRYGRDLAGSGVQGLQNGSQRYLNGQPLSAALGETARASLNLALLGIGAGLLQTYLGARRRRLSRGVALGALGGAVAFMMAASWKSRHLTSSMMKGALQEIGVVRDEHWLKGHPIDYA